ncbi:MAG: hypothetical protein QG593_144 [Patescibacteria group bacterium]|jgi:hypothetical protein|nr:hypothetical protein [Patescibacteria group bacterium]
MSTNEAVFSFNQQRNSSTCYGSRDSESHISHTKNPVTSTKQGFQYRKLHGRKLKDEPLNIDLLPPSNYKGEIEGLLCKTTRPPKEFENLRKLIIAYQKTGLFVNEPFVRESLYKDKLSLKEKLLNRRQKLASKLGRLAIPHKNPKYTNRYRPASRYNSRIGQLIESKAVKVTAGAVGMIALVGTIFAMQPNQEVNYDTHRITVEDSATTIFNSTSNYTHSTIPTEITPTTTRSDFNPYDYKQYLPIPDTESPSESNQIISVNIEKNENLWSSTRQSLEENNLSATNQDIANVVNGIIWFNNLDSPDTVYAGNAFQVDIDTLNQLT